MSVQVVILVPIFFLAIQDILIYQDSCLYSKDLSPTVQYLGISHQIVLLYMFLFN